MNSPDTETLDQTIEEQKSKDVKGSPQSPEMTLANEIIEALDERPAAKMVRDTVTTIGLERANAFFQQTLEIEANGGMETANGKRRRTPGGVFLYLVRKNVSTEERKAIFPKNGKPSANRKKKSSAKPAVDPLKWEDALKYARALLQHEKGQARSVEVKLIGRPAKVAKTQSCMVVMMEGKGAPKSLPKGLPTPPEQSQSFAVFISNKHWKKASEELKVSKNAELLVRGHPVFQPEKAMTMLLAQAVEVIERKPKKPKTE
ncbi:hypothetical protein KFU94_27460 [Chloroflexi bacterium TSY]|nr:hypothetical protein [Chloroflexi bacterium TSY]